MPTDSNLPAAVAMYLELIDRLMSCIDGHDSKSAESELVLKHVDAWLMKIADIMHAATQDEWPCQAQVDK